MKKYVAIAETVSDCKIISSWEHRNNATVQIIALSLETLDRYPDTIHVWKILPMEKIFQEAFNQCQELGKKWEKQFTETEDSLYDKASRYQLSEECWYHALVAEKTAKALSAHFKKEGWIYLENNEHKEFIGSRSSNFQKRGNNNALFKHIAAKIFREEGVFVVTISRVHNLFFVSSFSLVLPIIKKIIFNAAEYLYSRWKGVRPLSKRLRALDAKEQITHLNSGWGKDLSRFFDYQTLKEEMEKQNVFALNIISRPDKVKGYFNIKQSKKVQSLVTREDIRKGVSYGIRFSNFNLSIFFFSLIFFLKTTLPRWNTLKKGDEFFHSIFRHPIVRHNTKNIIYFSYLAAFLSKHVIDAILKEVPNLKIYLGSDSADTTARFEILYAKKKGLLTASAPHGFQGCTMEKYTYIADTILTQGAGFKEILIKKGVPTENIAIVGSSHERKEIKPPLYEKNVRITIGTRSRGGLWSNYSSKHDVYKDNLETLIDLLLHDGRFLVTIKSHPNGDYHEYYDHLVQIKNNKNLIHISTKWKLQQFFDLTDILVCVGEMPSFFISAFFGNIPVVYIKDTMTSLVRSTHGQYRYSAAVVENGQEAAETIRFISENEANYRSSVRKQREGLEKFDGGMNPEKLFLNIKRAI